MEEIVFLNGEFLPLSEAKIPVADYGFLYGYGVFETMRSYQGKVFRLERHLARLTESAGKLGIMARPDDLKQAVEDTIRKNAVQEARVRLSMTPGSGSFTPGPGGLQKTTTLVMVYKYLPYSPEIYARGFRAVISSIRRNSRSPLPGMKTANYLESLLARREAAGAGADEAVFLNEMDLVAEAAYSNLFIVSGGTLKTPGLETGILPGITRGVVLEIASGLGIPCLETGIQVQELEQADEAFLTNSMMEIMPLTVVDKKNIGAGRPGELTQKLMAAYREMVREETG